MHIGLVIAVLLFLSVGCQNPNRETKELVTTQLNASMEKVIQYLPELDVADGFPRNVKPGEYKWSQSGMGSWTSGFYPGMLWYLYEYSQDAALKEAALEFTHALEPVKELDWNTHDLGFMMFNSAGHAYRITENPEYKQWLLQTADSLAALFNPATGTILSWPWMKRRNNWPHNTIIDNMLNLELLFWAAKNGGSEQLYDIAVTHAQTTLKNHFRDDFSTWHVLVYDDESPAVLQKITDQGFSDESVWSRGQAWAIYGYTLCYRETGIEEFKQAAMGAANFYIEHLPSDYVPYWDFKLPDFTNEEKDASAAAIAASALIELAELTDDKNTSKKYYDVALNTLQSLSSDAYQSSKTMALLDHSVGSKPHNSEIDVPIIYADYYYVEALIRLWRTF